MTIPEIVRPFVPSSTPGSRVTLAESRAEDVKVGFLTRMQTTFLIDDGIIAGLPPGSHFGFLETASGPFPTPGDENYEPSFGLWTSPSVAAIPESLVHSWESGPKRILLPSREFLMTYGLSPRPFGEQELSWDQPSGPEYYVLKSRMEGSCMVGSAPLAYVEAKTRYLADYCALRQRVPACSYIVELQVNCEDAELGLLLGGHQTRDFDVDGGSLRIHRYDLVGAPVYQVEVRGQFEFVLDCVLSVSDEDGVDEELRWKTSDGERVLRGFGYSAFQGMDCWVYCSDSVLKLYERDEFDVDPLSGAVSFGSQWGQWFSHRVGRNLIKVELRKLYEGLRPQEVRDWHKHMVEVPEGNPQELRDAPNIARRTVRVAESLIAVDAALSRVSSAAGRSCGSFLPPDLGPVREGDYWGVDLLNDLASPTGMDDAEAQFIGRVKDLDTLVMSKFALGRLRTLANDLGCTNSAADNWGPAVSIGLSARAVSVAKAQGFDLKNDREAIAEKANEIDEKLREITLFVEVNKVRQMDAHGLTRADRERVDRLLELLGLTRLDMAGGWGAAIDAAYDHVAEALDALCDRLKL